MRREVEFGGERLILREVETPQGVEVIVTLDEGSDICAPLSVLTAQAPGARLGPGEVPVRVGEDNALFVEKLLADGIFADTGKRVGAARILRVQ